MSKQKRDQQPKPGGSGGEKGKPNLVAGDAVGQVGLPLNGATETGTDTPATDPYYTGAITLERWKRAQAAEREQHKFNFIEGAIHYGNAYNHYFRFVGLGRDLGSLNVIEVGPADFPALQQCVNGATLIVVEPMPSQHLEQICAEKGIALITKPFEECDLDIDTPGTTEVWLFNVMQHIIDPDKFIEQCKRYADRIRFFEPIDQPITEYHPHSYTIKDFQTWFPELNLYKGGSIEGFHEANCVYGVWIKS